MKRAQPLRFILPNMAKLMHEQGLNNPGFEREIIRVVLPIELISAAKDFVFRKWIVRSVNEGDRFNIKALRETAGQGRDFMGRETSGWGGHNKTNMPAHGI